MSQGYSGLNGVNGKTMVYGVIGDPVSHSFSPQIHSYFADLRGVNMVYVPFCVKKDDVGTAIAGSHALGIRGLNVTVPHKKVVMPHLVHVDPMAHKVGTVNTLCWTDEGYIGFNTDYIGINRTVKNLGLSFKGHKVAIIGAGGSAYAAAIAAADGGASNITIINRTLDNANLLAAHVNSYYDIPVETQFFSSFSENFDIIIQTTTVGFGELAGKSPLTDVKILEGTKLLLDIIYTPWETELMRQAKEALVNYVVNGFPMLVYQAAAAFELWHPPAVPPEVVLTDERHVQELEKRFHIS